MARASAEVAPLTNIADELASVMQVATEAAQKSAKIIREKTGADVIKTKGNPRDLLTEVDSEVQAIIEDAVSSAFPEHGFLGEESVPPGPEASTAALKKILDDPSSPDWLWIVDPIDGTTNFVHGMPLSAISIGVAYKGELVGGLIHDPFRDECFTATLGGGAFCNGKPIKVGKEATAGDATVASGYGATGSAGPVSRGMKAMVELPVRTFRMLGSAAIMFAWVACGRLTAYFEADLNAWDIAAGALLVQEAGGRMGNINGEEYSLSTRCVIGSNGLTHNELCAALQEANVLGLDDNEQ
eukprot:CAMPEP_0177770176 /NCGR_PEP_ID=MMETSP0491_2-20121128/10768_1 /TAXON_ID=63592 /ORGANISM="Tetraselmis chuii, Strain PLY429" /LENGTH=298 /DNA_ID=CAMNT_0019287339 /DNA_START=358 /DNA_END=1254 /DNA_ORIENTATION=+